MFTDVTSYLSLEAADTIVCGLVTANCFNPAKLKKNGLVTCSVGKGSFKVYMYMSVAYRLNFVQESRKELSS